MSVPLYQAKSEFFKTLGHPARILILELLSDGDKAVHELRAAIEVEASSLSQQLAVLRLAGLVAQRRESGEVIYSLALPAVRDLLAAAREILYTKNSDQGLVDELSRPAASQPAASQPAATQPAASQPAASQPAAKHPAAK